MKLFAGRVWRWSGAPYGKPGFSPAMVEALSITSGELSLIPLLCTRTVNEDSEVSSINVPDAQTSAVPVTSRLPADRGGIEVCAAVYQP